MAPSRRGVSKKASASAGVLSEVRTIQISGPTITTAPRISTAWTSVREESRVRHCRDARRVLPAGAVSREAVCDGETDIESSVLQRRDRGLDDPVALRNRIKNVGRDP